MYNVRELIDNLEKKVFGLGIDKKFRDNPAYASALTDIYSMISRIGLSEDELNSIIVTEKEGSILFNCTSSNGDKYEIELSCKIPNEFKCIVNKEKKPFVGSNGQMIKEVEANETVVTLNKNGSLSIKSNMGFANNLDCSKDECNITNTFGEKYYNNDGVMETREYKLFKDEQKYRRNIDDLNDTDLLGISRKANLLYDKHKERLFMRREKLDVALVYFEDTEKKSTYSAKIPLNTEHGLRDMILPGGYEVFPDDVVITPISDDEIEELIQKENNPKVAEGLRKYAIGRNKYYYDSKEDQNFKYITSSDTNGMTK